MPRLRTNRLSSIVLLVLLFFSVLFLASWGCRKDDQGGGQGGGRGYGQGTTGFSDEIVRRLDGAIVKRMQEDDLPGVVVGAWVPGEGRYVVSEGEANLKTGEERDLNDPFRIGSITKTFVATAILQLVEEGKLSKLDKLSKWYPHFPDADKITVRHLLRMQSGIVDPNEKIEQYTSPQEAIEASARLGGAFLPPGQRTEYTNINYVILGEIIAKVSGKDTDDQITQSILKPLSMKNTLYPTDSELPGDLHGYTLDISTGGLKDVTSFNTVPVGGAGAMISEVSDLKTWAKAVCTDKLLKEQTQKARLQTKHLSGDPDLVGYGEGIMKIGQFCGHAGAVPGFSSEMWYLAEKDATVIINVNRNDEFNPSPSGAVGEAIAKILFPEYVE
jgi:D-alanyl-D-alanine carboxypeptidase